MKDIYKTKKQLIKELEDTRRLLSQQATKGLKADSAGKEVGTYLGIADDKRDKEALPLIGKAIDSATDAIALSDPEGQHVYHNEAFTNIFEYTTDEMKAAGGGRAVFAVQSIAREVFGMIMNGISWSGEVEVKAKSGRIFSLFLRADAIKDDAGKIMGLAEIFMDLSERKRLEYELRKKHDELQLILDSIPAYIFYKDKDGRMLNINKAAMSLASAPKEKLLQKTVFDLLPQTADKYNRDDMEIIRSGQPKINIEESLELHGGTRWLKTDKLPIKDDDGNTVGLLGFSVDITKRKAAEEALRESESKYRFLAEKMNDIVWTLDMDFNTTYVSPSITEMLGYTPEERLCQPVKEQMTPESLERIMALLAAELEREGKEDVDPDRKMVIEVEYYHKNGSTVWVENVVSAIRDDKGKPIGLHGVSRDITERKKTERALQDSEQKLRWMFESIKDGIFIVGLDGMVMEVNAGVEKMTGYSRDQLLGQSGLDYMFPGFKGGATGMLQKVIARGRMQREVIVPMKTADGKVIEVEATSSALYDGSGNPIGLIGTVRDISERKRMEEAIRDSEEKLRLMFASMADGVVVTDIEGKITDINEAQLRMFGFKEKSELVDRGGFDFLAVRERGRALADMFKVYEEGFNIGSTYTVVDKDGREFECELSTAMLHDAAGKPSGTVTVMRDVTDRRRMEQVLRESEERYRLLAENVSDVIWTMDMNLKYTYVSPSVLKLRGFTAEEAMGMSIEDTLTSSSVKTAMQIIREELEVDHSDQYTFRTLELELKRKDSSTVWTEMKVSFLYDADRNRTGLMGVTRDITERKRTEEALRETSEKLRVVFDSIGEAVTLVDLDGNILDANKEALRLHGFNSKNEIIGRKSAELVAVIDRERAVNDAVKSLKPPYLSGRSEYKLVDAGGREFDGEFNVAVLRDDKGKPAGFIGIGRDVSERRQIEEALRESEEYFKEITENSSDMVIITDKNGDIKYCSHSIERFSGYKPEELIGESAFKFIHPDDVQRAVDDFGKAILLEDVMFDAFRIVHKDGTERFFEGQGRNLLDNPSVAGFIMNVRDVTERNKIEEALRDSEEKLRVMFDSMMDGIVISDPNIKIVDINRAAIEMVGSRTKEDLIGRSATDVIRFKNLDEAMDNLAKMFNERCPQEKVEYSIILPGDRELEVEVSTAMMHDNAGNIIGFVNAIRDVSDRKKWEEALKKSEEKYRNLVEREKDVIVSVDSLGFVKSVNSAVAMWGYTTDEVMKMNFLELIAPEWREVTATELQTRLLETGEYVGETVGIRKDGEERPIEYSAVVVYDEQGQYSGAQAIVRDISERKKMEEALQARERYFRAVLDLSSGAILVLSVDGKILDATGGLERISGYKREATIGHSAVEFIHPEELEKVGAAIEEAMRNPGKTVAFEARLKNALGEWQWTECMITNLLEHSDVQGIVNHMVDITERKKTEEDIKLHAKRVEALYGVAQVISQASTLEAMLNDSLNKVCSAMDTESGCIFMLDLDDKALKLKAVRGMPKSAAQQFSTIVLTEEGIEKIVGLSGPFTEIDEAHTVVDVEGTQRVTAELGRKSIAATPLFRGNDIQGLIVVFTSKDRTFSGEDLELFRTTANEISIGINNMMLMEKTREMSVTDELTGLYNRRYFFEMLDVEMNRAGRTNRPFSLAMIDLDGFKEYNDKYGHSNGDAVLETFSQVLRTSIRKSDMAFRYGGDEFSLVLPGADAEKAKKIVQRMRAKWQKASLSQSVIFGGYVGFSSGIAEYPQNAESPDGLIFLADAALYQAKKKGYEDKLVSELRTLSTDVMDVATQDQVYALAATVDARDPYTSGHSQRVADIATVIGKRIGMSEEDLAKLHAAALLHDIGKIGVPDSILTKLGKPTPEEWDVIKKHCAEGARILGYVKELAALVPIVLHHHEWYDGSGYPGGLKGVDIPSGARITSVADAYDTMVTKRPYRDIVTPKAACEELKRCAGTQFDPVIVDAWCKWVEKEGKKDK